MQDNPRQQRPRAKVDCSKTGMLATGGFNGSRVGMARVVSENDAQLLETLTKVNSKHAQKQSRSVYSDREKYGLFDHGKHGRL